MSLGLKKIRGWSFNRMGHVRTVIGYDRRVKMLRPFNYRICEESEVLQFLRRNPEERRNHVSCAFGEEIGVLSPEDDFSVRNPVIEEESISETEVGEVDNGVASVAAKENAQT
ncbi:hypothetical protein HAX54_042219 [Datura stramonium]|uniref:MBD domain-containing protein n=1 Tax=Datura stramonium TaxID=4076 RepID=A0ABS8VYQ8_DATST|nr:hypothetical protein [Datura stramonium]